MLVDRVGSGGDQPISVTAHGGIAYVLNAGGSGNIVGFSLDGADDLTPIAGSSRSLSTAASGPAEIAFNPAGTALLVTEKNTNRLTTYKVGTDGLASAGTWIASAGVTPFGFAFDARGRAIVSEASGGGPGREHRLVVLGPRRIGEGHRRSGSDHGDVRVLGRRDRERPLRLRREHRQRHRDRLRHRQ